MTTNSFAGREYIFFIVLVSAIVFIISIQFNIGETVVYTVGLEEKQMVEKTSTSDKQCIGSSCTLVIYSGVVNVLEDNIWKNYKDARSLKNKNGFEVLFLEIDPNLNLTVIDYNATSVTIQMSTSASLVNQLIPFKIWKPKNEANATNDIKEYKTKYNKNKEDTYSFALTETKTVTYNIELGDVLEFGFNSTTIVLQTSTGENLADSYVRLAQATTNFGTSASINMLLGATDIEHSIFMFNLTMIPAGARIDAANLSLNFPTNNLDVGTEGYNITIYRVNRTYSWTETGITWNTRPTESTGIDSVNPGGKVIVTGTTATGWWEWNATKPVQDAFNGGDNNVTLFLNVSEKLGSPDNTDLISARSRDYGADGTVRPKLTITYTVLPVITIVFPQNTTYGFRNSYDFNVTTNVQTQSTRYNLNNGANISMSSPNNLTWNASNISIAGGSYTFNVFANDSDNNQANASVVFSINLSQIETCVNITSSGTYIVTSDMRCPKDAIIVSVNNVNISGANKNLEIGTDATSGLVAGVHSTKNNTYAYNLRVNGSSLSAHSTLGIWTDGNKTYNSRFENITTSNLSIGIDIEGFNHRANNITILGTRNAGNDMVAFQAENITISNVTIRYSAAFSALSVTETRGIYLYNIQDLSGNTIFQYINPGENAYDTFVYDSNSTGRNYMESPSNSTFINFTYKDEAVGAGGTIFRYWYADVSVLNCTGSPFQNANVSIRNVSQTLLFNVLTDATGNITRQTLLRYTNTSTTVFRSPFNFTVRASGMTTNETSQQLTTNLQLSVTLCAAPPTVRSINQNINVEENKTDLGVFGRKINQLLNFDEVIKKIYGTWRGITDRLIFGGYIPPQDGLVAWWSLDENVTPLQDKSITNNPMYNQSGANFSSSGVIEGEYRCDGVNDFLNASTNLSYNMTGPDAYTLLAWVTPLQSMVASNVTQAESTEFDVGSNIASYRFANSSSDAAGVMLRVQFNNSDYGAKALNVQGRVNQTSPSPACNWTAMDAVLGTTLSTGNCGTSITDSATFIEKLNLQVTGNPVNVTIYFRDIDTDVYLDTITWYHGREGIVEIQNVMGLWISGRQLRPFTYNISGTNFNGPITHTFTTNTQTFVGGMFNGTNLFEIWQGDISTTSTAVVGGEQRFLANPVKLCRSDNWASYGYMKIDEVLLYNRTLSSTELSTIYNARINERVLGVIRTALFSEKTTQLFNLRNILSIAQKVSAKINLAINLDEVVKRTYFGFKIFSDIFNIEEFITRIYRAIKFPNLLLNLEEFLSKLGFFKEDINQPLEFCEYQTPQDGLVGWWKLDQNNTNQTDSSIYGNTGTVKLAEFTDSGKIKGAYSFNGINNSYINVSSPQIDKFGIAGSNYTIAVWQYRLSDTDISATEKWTGAPYPFVMRRNTCAAYNGSTGGNPSAGYTAALNQWNLVVCVYDTNITSYVNGVKGSSNNNTVRIYNINNTGPFPLGNRQFASKFWNGSLDEFRFYNRSLSITEVQQLYAATSNDRVCTADTTASYKRENVLTILFFSTTSKFKTFYTSILQALNIEEVVQRTVFLFKTIQNLFNFGNVVTRVYETIRSSDLFLNIEEVLIKLGFFTENINQPIEFCEYQTPQDGLVGWWKLDQNNTNQTDSSIYGNTGIVTNATFINSGKIGGAYNFSGGTQFMNATIPTIVTPYSVAFWYYPSVTPSSTAQIIGLQGAGTYPKIEVRATGRMLFYLGNEKYRYTATNTILAGNWYYVVFVANQTNVSQLHIYVNGVLVDGVGGGDTGTYVEPTTFLKVGNNSRTDIIDELRIYNRSLSLTEIQQLYQSTLNNRVCTVDGTTSFTRGNTLTILFFSSVSKLNQFYTNILQVFNFEEFVTRIYGAFKFPNLLLNLEEFLSKLGFFTEEINQPIEFCEYQTPQDGLVGWWKLDQNNTNQIDSSGNNSNGSIVGTPIFTSSGKIGGTYDTRKTGGVFISNKYNLTAWSVAYWMYQTENITSWTSQVDKGYHGTGGTPGVHSSWAFLSPQNINGCGVLFELYRNASWNSQFKYNAECNQWHHIVGTFNGTVARLYFDNVLVDGPDTIIDAAEFGDRGLGIGVNDLGTGNYFNGSIDEVRIYNRSISVTEVQQLYQSTMNDRVCTVDGTASFTRGNTLTILFFSSVSKLNQFYTNLLQVLNFDEFMTRITYLFRGQVLLINIEDSVNRLSQFFFNNPIILFIRDVVSKTLFGSRTVNQPIDVCGFDFPTDGLVSFYSFDNDDSITAYDNWNGNIGTYYNGSITNITGYIESGATFDGVNDYIAVNDSISLDMYNETSISVWFNTAKTINPRVVLVGKHYLEYEIVANPSGCIHTYSANGLGGYDEGITVCIDGNLSSGETDWLVNKWYNVVWTLNKSLEKVWVNGVYLGNYTKGHNGSQPGTHKFEIGRRADPNAGLYFNGTIDEVRIYNRTITAEEAVQIYQSNENDKTCTMDTTASFTRSNVVTLIMQSSVNRLSKVILFINQNLNMNNVVNRIYFGIRTIVQNINLEDVVTRLSRIFRLFAQMIGLSPISDSEADMMRSLNLTIGVDEGFDTTLVARRGIVDTFTINTVITRTVAMFRIISQSVNVLTVITTNVTQTFQQIFVNIAQSLNVNTMIDRTSYIFRFLTQAITFVLNIFVSTGTLTPATIPSGGGGAITDTTKLPPTPVSEGVPAFFTKSNALLLVTLVSIIVLMLVCIYYIYERYYCDTPRMAYRIVLAVIVIIDLIIILGILYYVYGT